MRRSSAKRAPDDASIVCAEKQETRDTGTQILIECAILRAQLLHRARGLRLWTCNRRLTAKDDPMRALLLIHVEALAVVAAHAFRHDDFRPFDRTPLTRLLAQLARVAFRPALDAENREFGEEPQGRTERTQEATVQISDEHRRDEQHAERRPHHGGFVAGKHPERLDVSINRHVARREKINYDAGEDPVLDFRRLSLDAERHVVSVTRRHDRIEQLRQRAVRADAPAIQPSEQHGRRDRKAREGIPAQVVFENRQVAAHDAEDVHDRQQLALVDAEVHHGCDERHVLQLDAFPKKTRERERRKRCKQPYIESLARQQLLPRLDRLLFFFEIPRIFGGRRCLRVYRDAGRATERTQKHRDPHDLNALCSLPSARPGFHLAGGVSSCVAMRRALIRIARAALVTVIVARDTASTSPPTRNGSRMLLPLNCAANSGRSTEKSPYGSLCAATMMPVRIPLVSIPTRILIGPS